MPSQIKPMLAKVAKKPFSDSKWIYEIKWDGYRAIAETGKKEVRFYSRNGHSFKDKYKKITTALKKIKKPAVLDGEVVMLDENGKSDFQRLQDYGEPQEGLYYYVFDLLYYKGNDLRDKPLLKRKEILKKLINNKGIIRYGDHVKKEGESFFKSAQQNDLEGIMAKKADSVYRTGKRSAQWLKIKNQRSLEAIIGGYTKPRGSRKYFGALILGVFKDKDLKYIGHSGTGFSNKTLKTLYEKMQPLISNKNPFKEKVPVNNPATWLRPQLICNIKYTEKTKEEILRHPVFLGLRPDKEPNEVQWNTQMNDSQKTSPQKK